MLSNFTAIFLTMSSMFFCGQIGQNELAAASFGSLTFNIVCNTVIYGFSTACDTLYPQIFGGEDKKKIGVIMQKALVISVITSVFSSSAILNTKYILGLIIEEPHVIILTDIYLKALIPGCFVREFRQYIGCSKLTIHKEVFFHFYKFFGFVSHLTKYLQSQNIVSPVMYINCASVPINLLLQYLLVFQFDLGIIGSALSADISSFFIFASLLLYIRIKRIYVLTWPGFSFRHCFENWRIYLVLAIPGFFMLALEWAAVEIATLMSGRLGVVAVNSLSVCQLLNTFVFQLPLGICIAGSIHVGQLLGANQPAEAINALRVFMTIAWIYAIFDFVLILSLSNYLPYAFGNDTDFIKYTQGLLKLDALVHFMSASGCIVSTIMRIISKQFVGSIIVLVCWYAIALPLGLGLMLYTRLEVYGMFLGLILSPLCQMICQFFVIFRTDWVKYAQKTHEASKIKRTNPNEVQIEINSEQSLFFIVMKRAGIFVVAFGLLGVSIYFNLTREVDIIVEQFNSTEVVA